MSTPVPDKTFRIFLLDDHTVVRQGTRNMLNSHPLLNVVGECACGAELLEGLTETRPDLLLLDIGLPDCNGFELLADVQARFPDLKVLFFSAHAEAQYVRRAKALKVAGFLSKTIDEAMLREMVLQALRSEEESAFLSDVPLEETATTKAPLTARETEILHHLARGLGNREIARHLSVSVKTVDTHIANLMKKTGVNKRTQLLVLAYEQGWAPFGA